MPTASIWGGALAFALLTGACGALDWDTSGFEQLGGKAPRAIDLPGTELGTVADFTPIAALGKRGTLSAIAGVTGQGKVQVISASDGESCTAFTLSVANPARHLPAALEHLLAVQQERDADGRGTLRVFDDRCKEVTTPLPHARPVSGSERLVPLRLLIESEGDLVALAAADEQLDVVDREVSFVAITATHVVSVAQGELVVRDLALRQRARHGRAVSEVVLVAGGSRIAYVDGGRLLWLAEPEAEPQRVSEDACGVSVADGTRVPGGPRYLSYFSPCAESRLEVFDHVATTRTEIGVASESRAVVHARDGDVVTFYLAPAEDSETERSIWVRSRDGAAELVPGTALVLGLASADGVTVWNGTKGAPLQRWSHTGVSPLFDAVDAFEAGSYPERALLGDGRLLQLEGRERPRELARGATSTGRGGGTASLFFSDVDGEVGALRLLQADRDAVEAVADRVHLPSASFWYTGQSLFFHRNHDTGTGIGDLCMRLLENGDTFCEPDVRDFRVMIRPERGVVLTKGVGDEQRLFWAAVE